MARPTRIRRKDLKRPDEFVTLSAQALAWGRANQRAITWATVALAAALVVLASVVALHRARQRDANADLGAALAAYRDPKTPNAAAQLAEVARHWSRTFAGDVAQLLGASAELRHDNADSALVVAQEAARHRGWPTYLSQLTLLLNGFAHEAKGQLPDAITKYTEAAATEGPYTAQALLGQARCQRAAGNMEAAVKIQEQLRKDFPEVAEKELVGTGAAKENL